MPRSLPGNLLLEEEPSQSGSSQSVSAWITEPASQVSVNQGHGRSSGSLMSESLRESFDCNFSYLYAFLVIQVGNYTVEPDFPAMNGTVAVTPRGRTKTECAKASWTRNYFTLARCVVADANPATKLACIPCLERELKNSKVRKGKIPLNEKDVAMYMVGSGTKNRMDHLNKHHGIFKAGTQRSATRQTTLTRNGTVAFPEETTINDDDKVQLTRALTHFIIDCKLPFSLVESTQFRKFCRLLNDCDGFYKVPCRGTLVSSLADLYQEEKRLFF